MKINIRYDDRIPVSFLVKQDDKNNGYSSEIYVQLPSCVGNWNSCVPVKAGETKEFNICVEDVAYLLDLKKKNIAKVVVSQDANPDYSDVSDPRSATYDPTSADYKCDKDSSNKSKNERRASYVDGSGDTIPGDYGVKPFYVPGSNPAKVNTYGEESLVSYYDASGTELSEADVEALFGSAYVWKYFEDKEIIKAAASDSTAVEATAPRYGSVVLYDDNTYKVFRIDDTWGGFPKEGTNLIYAVNYTTGKTDPRPTSWGTGETADGDADVVFTYDLATGPHFWFAVEQGTPMFKTIKITVGLDPAVELAWEKVEGASYVNDALCDIYYAPAPLGALPAACDVTIVYA